MSKRETAIHLLRVAGYHNDSGDFMRLYVENRVSYETAKKAFADGARAKASGVRCTCSQCKQAA